MKNHITTHEFKRCLFIGALIIALTIFSFMGTVFAAQPAAVTDMATYFSDTTMFLNGAINPENALTNVWFEWGPNTSLEYKTPVKVISTSGSVIVRHSDYVSNLISKKTYYFRIVAQNTNGIAYGSTLSFVAGTNIQSGAVQTATTASGGGTGTDTTNLIAAPLVTTAFPSSIGQASATFLGLANPQGGNTQVWFEFGRTQAFGATIGHQNIGNGNTVIKFEHPLINLQPNTTYYYRAAAQNSGGTIYGNIISFSTTNETQASLPKAETKTISVIHQNVAVLPASLNPNGAFTHAWFEWGADEKLGNASQKSLRGDGSAPQDFLFVLSGLEPDTKYFYRVAAENSKGRVNGDTLYFTTRAMPKPVALPIITGSAPLPSKAQAQVQVPAVQPQTVLAEAKGLLVLTGKIESSAPKSGGELIYILDYKNESQIPLFSLNIKVVLPSEVSLIESSSAVNDSSANAHNFIIGMVRPGASGSVTIKTEVAEVADKTMLIFSGMAEYLTPAAEFKTASVFTGVSVGGGETFSFAALVGGTDLSWFIFIAALVLFAFFMGWRYLHKRRLAKTKSFTAPQPPSGLPIQPAQN